MIIWLANVVEKKPIRKSVVKRLGIAKVYIRDKCLNLNCSLNFYQNDCNGNRRGLISHHPSVVHLPVPVPCIFKIIRRSVVSKNNIYASSKSNDKIHYRVTELENWGIPLIWIQFSLLPLNTTMKHMQFVSFRAVAECLLLWEMWHVFNL